MGRMLVSYSSLVRLGLTLLGLAGLAAALQGSAGMAEEALSAKGPYGDTSGRVTEGTAAGRPNIILFLTDDQPLYTLANMPEVREWMVGRGTTFGQTFNSFPLCCPGRATIQRGQYSFNHGVLGNSPPAGGWQRFDELNREQSTVATWLDDAGYRTGYFGKYMNGYETNRVPPGWDRWQAQIGEYKYSRRVNENGEIHDYDPEIHQDAYYAGEALRWVDGAVRRSEPVFLQMSFHAPHSPANYQTQYAGDFASARVPRTPDFNELDFSDKPYERPFLTEQQVAEADAHHRRQLRSLQTVDATVREAIRTIRSLGELDNTYFLFYTDNGSHNGHHREEHDKLEPYYTDTRFPLLVRGPGVPEGTTNRKLISNNDIAPTIAALADAETSAFVDGRPLIPLLDSDPSNDEPWRTTLLSQRVGEWWALAEDRSDAPPITYIEHSGGRRELYDRAADPYEVQNFYGSVSEEEKTRLHERLETIIDCAGEGCGIAEDGPPMKIRQSLLASPGQRQR